MAGNTRGKLKEHFEGIHRNFDWSISHVQNSLTLIATQLSFTEAMVAIKGDAEKEEQVLTQNPLYSRIQALGQGIETLDSLAQEVYAKL